MACLRLVGLALVLIFGTQAVCSFLSSLTAIHEFVLSQDVFRAWCFWRRVPHPVLPQTPVEHDGSFAPVRVDLIDSSDKNGEGEIQRPPTAWRISRH
jgi:hypothetical protein